MCQWRRFIRVSFPEPNFLAMWKIFTPPRAISKHCLLLHDSVVCMRPDLELFIYWPGHSPKVHWNVCSWATATDSNIFRVSGNAMKSRTSCWTFCFIMSSDSPGISCNRRFVRGLRHSRVTPHRSWSTWARKKEILPLITSNVSNRRSSYSLVLFLATQVASGQTGVRDCTTRACGY